MRPWLRTGKGRKPGDRVLEFRGVDGFLNAWFGAAASVGFRGARSGEAGRSGPAAPLQGGPCLTGVPCLSGAVPPCPLESPGCGAAAEPLSTPTSPASRAPASPTRTGLRTNRGLGAWSGTVSAGVLSGKPLPRSQGAPRARHRGQHQGRGIGPALMGVPIRRAGRIRARRSDVRAEAGRAGPGLRWRGTWRPPGREAVRSPAPLPEAFNLSGESTATRRNSAPGRHAWGSGRPADSR